MDPNPRLTVLLTFKEVRGVICGQKFSIDLDSEDQVIPTAQGFLMDQITNEFPAPVRGSVATFILRRLQF